MGVKFNTASLNPLKYLESVAPINKNGDTITLGTDLYKTDSNFLKAGFSKDVIADGYINEIVCFFTITLSSFTAFFTNSTTSSLV